MSLRSDASDYLHLAGHMMGFAEKSRVTQYGRIAFSSRQPTNGTITEVQGWVDPPTFAKEYRGKRPVVFRGAAIRENGFDIQCLQEAGSVVEAMRRELGETKIRVFRDEYDDGSAEWMTFTQYELIAAQARANKSLNMPYARSFPVENLKSCGEAVPKELLAARRAPWALTHVSRSLKQQFAFLSVLKGTTTKLHLDTGDSFFTEVFGRKRWLFVEPQFAKDLKIYADSLNLVYVAGYDVFRENLPPHVPVREVILNPGDVLYFPSMTLHAVENLDEFTLGIDDAAMDAVNSFRRHWLLTVGTLLNPYMIYKSLEMIVRTGALNGYELYFDGFSRNSKNADKPSSQGDL